MPPRRPTLRTLAPLHPVIFRCDLDKTYLKSEFETLREMARIPFEKPEDKIAVPGVVALMRNLRRVAADAGREVRLYFISASPPQIAKAIRDKLALDGIEYDGITFKNQLQHLVRGKFRNLREQVGYKLTELLRGRPGFPADAREVLFGDDWESDPIIYSLYADVLAGRIPAPELRSVLEAISVDPKQIAEAETLTAAVARFDAVERIYINLDRRSPPAAFRLFGPRLVPTFNYFQTAACLFQDGYLTPSAVAEVAESLVSDAGYTPMRLANSLADITRRDHLQQSSAIAVREYLRARRLLPQASRDSAARATVTQRVSTWVRRVMKPATPLPIAAPAPINYRTLVAEWRQAR